MGVRTVGILLMTGAALMTACARDGRVIAPAAALRSSVLSCTAGSAGSKTVAIELEPTPQTPPAVAALIPHLRLSSYNYRSSSAPAADATSVLPVPLPSGAGNVLDLSTTDASVQDAPPPVALIPTEGNRYADLILAGLLMVHEAEIALRGDSLERLLGVSVDMPIGTATVNDVHIAGEQVTVTVSLDWVDGLGGSSAFQPRVSIVPAFGPGGAPLGDIGVDFNGASSQSLRFRLPVGRQDDPVALRLSDFGVEYAASVRVTGIGQACGG